MRYLIVAARLDDGRLAVSHCGLTRPISEAAGLLGYIQSLDREGAQSRVWGRVTIPTGGIDPLPGARMTVSGPVRRSTATDAEGRYVFVDLPSGTYSLNAEVPASLPDLVMQPGILQSNEVTLTGGNVPACAELNFYARFNGAISGEVVDQQGKPLGGVIVELRAAGRDLWTNTPVESIETDLSGDIDSSG
jgi:Carboxypeptidase regulatory-like domain